MTYPNRASFTAGLQSHALAPTEAALPPRPLVRCNNCYWAKSASRDVLATKESLVNTSMRTPWLSTVIITCPIHQHSAAGRCSIPTPFIRLHVSSSRGQVMLLRLPFVNNAVSRAKRCLHYEVRAVSCSGEPSSLPLGKVPGRPSLFSFNSMQSTSLRNGSSRDAEGHQCNGRTTALGCWPHRRP